MQRNRASKMRRSNQLSLAPRMRRQDGIVSVRECERVLAGSLVCGAALDEPEGGGVGLRGEGFGEVGDGGGVLGCCESGLAARCVGVGHLVYLVVSVPVCAWMGWWWENEVLRKMESGSRNVEEGARRFSLVVPLLHYWSRAFNLLPSPS